MLGYSMPISMIEFMMLFFTSRFWSHAWYLLDLRISVAPDIDTFVVYHEQTSKYFLWRVEVYTITMGDMNIIFHISGSFMIVTNEWALFRLSLFTFSWTLWHLLINYEYWWIKIFTINCSRLEKRFFGLIELRNYPSNSKNRKWAKFHGKNT